MSNVNKFAVSTDSTSDLYAEEIEKMGVYVGLRLLFLQLPLFLGDNNIQHTHHSF